MMIMAMAAEIIGFTVLGFVAPVVRCDGDGDRP